MTKFVKAASNVALALVLAAFVGGLAWAKSEASAQAEAREQAYNACMASNSVEMRNWETQQGACMRETGFKPDAIAVVTRG